MARVFVAGATGAVGRVLIPKVVEAGHEVAGMTRSPERAAEIEAAGATAVVADVFDAAAVRDAVVASRPNVVVNQLTDLPRGGLNPKKLAEYYERNNRVRREGTENLLAAARAAGATRFVAQSVAFFYDPAGAPTKDEEAPLWRDAPEPFGEAVRALEHSERLVLESELDAVVLRYGTFYGPGTWYSRDGEVGRQIANRRYPIIGKGTGVNSFIHVEDAADVCAAFVERGAPGVYNVVDDEPATASEWARAFADAVGAKPPRRVPAWLARRAADPALVEWSTTLRGASNAKVKRELGWEPRYPSWRRGFVEALG